MFNYQSLRFSSVFFCFCLYRSLPKSTLIHSFVHVKPGSPGWKLPLSCSHGRVFYTTPYATPPACQKAMWKAHKRSSCSTEEQRIERVAKGLGFAKAEPMPSEALVKAALVACNQQVKLARFLLSMLSDGYVRSNPPPLSNRESAREH